MGVFYVKQKGDKRHVQKVEMRQWNQRWEKKKTLELHKWEEKHNSLASHS